MGPAGCNRLDSAIGIGVGNSRVVAVRFPERRCEGALEYLDLLDGCAGEEPSTGVGLLSVGGMIHVGGGVG